MIKYNYENYTVIVTGGTRGIGKSIVENFLKNGATVIANYVGNEERAQQLKDEFSNFNLKLAKFDVANYAEVEKFFKDFDTQYESLDVLVNNAGIRKDGVVGMMPFEDWNSVIATNLTGTYNMSKFAVMKMLHKRFGRIINITSPSGKLGFPGQANYASAKAGQVAFSKSLSKEVGRRNITVNCISPGFIDTELIADLPKELVKEYKSRIPSKKFGTPQDIANAAMFLSSDESSYITGTILEVTGGI